jgi:hypothetical protein
MQMKMVSVAGSVFLEMIFVLSFLPLKAEVDALAIAEGAGNFESLLATIFPYLWIFLIIAFAGLIFYGLVFKN